METIRVDCKKTSWERTTVLVPEGMTKEKFIEHLMKEDPFVMCQDNSDTEDIPDTSQYHEAEYFLDDDEFPDDVPFKKFSK